MYEVIEAYDASSSATLHGLSVPGQCLIEDVHGHRVLLVGAEVYEILQHTWLRAMQAGALGIVRLDGSIAVGIRTEDFQVLRQEGRGTYSVPLDVGYPMAMPPTVLELFADHAAPTSDGGFVHLHTHSDHSALDGLSKITELVECAVADNQPALAITDHGICAGHPDLQKEADKAGIKPIFGVEAYFVDDRHNREKGTAYDYWHLVLWAMNQEGLHNLWAASTEANRTGVFGGKPRMDWEILRRYSAGVGCSTGCIRGPVSDLLRKGREREAMVNLGKLMEIFQDRLWVELHTNKLPEQQQINLQLVDWSQQIGLPTIAVVDSHYPTADHADCHQVWIAAQTNKDLQDEGELFAGDSDYHAMTRAEVEAALSYLPDSVVHDAVTQTVEVAKRCDATITSKPSAPVFSKVGGPEEDERRLREICLANWDRIPVERDPDKESYEDRFEREMALISKLGFCGYFLMVSDYTGWAKRQGILVGPGRGSGGGCLVAWLSDITSIDPIDADLIFERFLTEGRIALPDFDIDFPQSMRDRLQQHIVDTYGEDHVVRVGSVGHYKNKGIVRSLARVLKSTIEIDYADIDAICKIIDEAESGEAGLGLKWEDLWDQHGELLDPYRAKYPDLFKYADMMVGRVSNYGKHAAGLVISINESLNGRLPMRDGEQMLISEWDMNVLEELGLVKFDLLTLRTLDTIQFAVDLIEKRHGARVNVNEWTKEQYDDPMVWDEICALNTFGIFQIETTACTRLCQRLQPRSLSDLSDVIALVRPGPMRSGLTDTYLRRRHGYEEVSFPHPSLSEVLGKTYGAMIYQEDVMSVCMVLAGYDSVQADTVRKLLGKKQRDKAAEAGRQFVAACSAQGVDLSISEPLWEQMAEFAKYVFNRAHSWAYAVLGYWTAWLKVHYPAEFMTALLSTIDSERLSDTVRECRRMGFEVLPPDINLSGDEFTTDGIAIRYAFNGIMGIGEATTAAIMESQPYTSFQDFLDRRGQKCNMGDVKTLVRAGVFDSLFENRRQLLGQVEWDTSKESGFCVHRDPNVPTAPDEEGNVPLPCGFDWSSEPVEFTKSGKPKKTKPPPKRCTKACRQYVQVTAPVLIDEPNFTPADVRDIEAELFGIHLSSTVFDQVPDDLLEETATAEQIRQGDDGMYPVVGVVTKKKAHTDRSGKQMGFFGIELRDGMLDAACFNSVWSRIHIGVREGDLVVASMIKNGSRLQVADMLACPLNSEVLSAAT